MSSGLPVVATAVGGNADLVTHGETGEIVPSGDAELMADSLSRLASEPSRAAEMGRAGRSKVESRFSMPAMVNAYSIVYDRQLAVAQYRKKGV